MQKFQTFQINLQNPKVLEIALHRPEVRNAFNEVMMAELLEVFQNTKKIAPRVQVIALRGEGPTFCAGGDLNWMKKAVDDSFEDNLKDTKLLTKMFQTMNECPLPVVGLVHGAAIGGGVGLVSVCDIVISPEDTKFSLSEVRLGIVPACIGPFVISKIGASQARRLFLSAERIDALEAKRIGLVHQTEKNLEDAKQSFQKLIEQVLQCGPNALSVAKKMVLDLSWPEKRDGLSDPYHYVAETLAKLRISEEGQDGVRAFLEKRKPKWIES